MGRRSRFTGMSPDQIREATEDARRGLRYKAAKTRVQQIIAGSPRLTDAQLRTLADEFHAATEQVAA